MAQYGALKATNHLSEFTEPLVGDETGVGVVSAATRQAEAVANIGLAASIADLDMIDGQATAPLTVGAGANSGESYASSIVRSGGLIHTTLVIDITDLVSSATTDLDIIGDASAAASANIGQVTAAMGTLIAGRMTCLEAPAAGVIDDIDLYAADESNAAAQSLVTDLTNDVALVTSGAVWTNGRALGMVGLPAANQYLYLTNGASDTGGTHTSGKFLIEFWGTPA